MKKKISIIGLGKIGKKHFSELRRSDYFELVGICDKNEKLDNFAKCLHILAGADFKMAETDDIYRNCFRERTYCGNT